MTSAAAVGAGDFLMPTYRRWPVEIVSGSGCTLVDAGGRSYLDLSAGIAVASVGHAPAKVAGAVSEQVARLVHVSNLYGTRPQVDLAARLAELTGGKLAFFTNSGSEAVECALKLVRKWSSETKGPDATRIVAAENAFHGRTFGALAATGQRSKREPFEPMLPGFTHVPFGDLDALARAMDEDVAAILLEPVQGEAGVVVPPSDYLAGARALCDRWGALLVLDEIQTGLARTGRWFAYDHFEVTPDVLCVAKALAAGLPLGACLASPHVANAFTVGDHGSTFGGGPVQCAAALATLDVIESEGLCERAGALGRQMTARLSAALGRRGTVRGLGLLIGIDLGRPLARTVAASALEKGVLVNDATPSVVRITPPLVISDGEVEQAVELLEEVFDEIGTP